MTENSPEGISPESHESIEKVDRFPFPRTPNPRQIKKILNARADKNIYTADGHLNGDRVEALLDSLHGPGKRDDSPEGVNDDTDAILATLNGYDGRYLSAPRVIATLAGHDGETLTKEMLDEFLAKYPNPLDVASVVAAHCEPLEEEKEKRDKELGNFAEYYTNFVEVVLHMVYGKKQEYAWQIALIAKMSPEERESYRVSEDAGDQESQPTSAQRSEEGASQDRITDPEEAFRIVLETRNTTLARNAYTKIMVSFFQKMKKDLKEQGKEIDETVFDTDEYFTEYFGDQVRVRASDALRILSGIYNTYPINEDTAALEEVLGRPLNYGMIKTWPYGVSYSL